MSEAGCIHVGTSGYSFADWVGPFYPKGTASGEFLGYLEGRFGENHDTLVVSEIDDKDAIYESIKTFLGKGR